MYFGINSINFPAKYSFGSTKCHFHTTKGRTFVGERIFEDKQFFFIKGFLFFDLKVHLNVEFFPKKGTSGRFSSRTVILN